MDCERLRFACVLVVTACTVSNDSTGFTSTPTTASTVSSTMTVGDSGDAESETGSSTTAGDDTSGTGGLGSSDDGSSGVTTLDGSSSSGAVDPTDGQPMDGIWSPCIDAMECGNPGFCITNADMTDGFCSALDCANPALDCPASPGGTSTPACAPVTVDGEMQMACVLNCAGLVCPTGMVCMNFTDLGMICM
jgi:hypothetical protein